MNDSVRSSRRLVITAMIGTVCEWYDFSIYGFLAPLLAPLFFPHQKPWLALLLAYVLFAVGFLMRPLGGLICGYWGDRLGRRVTLFFTLLLMSFSTLGMACLPTYAAWGVAAPICLCGLRMLQGFAAGGETMGAMIFAYESVPPQQRARMSTVVWIGTGTGVLLGSLVIAAGSTLWSHRAWQSEYWRVPFALAAITAVVGLWMRWQTTESLAYREYQATHREDTLSPLREAWREHRRAILCLIVLFSPGALIYYAGFVFLPSVILHSTHVYASTLFWINVALTGMMLVLCPLVGGLADRMGGHYTCWIQSSLVAMALLTVPLFSLFSSAALWEIVIGQSGLVILIACYSGCIMAYASQQFPIHVRYSSMAIAYNVCYSLFGGTIPLIAAYVWHHSGSLFGIGVYVASMSLMAWCLLRYLMSRAE